MKPALQSMVNDVSSLEARRVRVTHLWAISRGSLAQRVGGELQEAHARAHHQGFRCGRGCRGSEGALSRGTWATQPHRCWNARHAVASIVH